MTARWPQPILNGVNFNASVRLDLSTLRDVEPAKVEAIMAGIAQIVTATSAEKAHP
jgi:hypothetical protein